MPLANLITINKIITPWNIIWTGGGRGADQSNSCSNLPTCTWIYTVLINTGETLEKSGDKLTRIRISLSRRTTSVKFSVIRPYVIARTLPSNPHPSPDLFHLLSNQRHDPFFDLRHSAGIRNGQYVLRFLLPRKNVILSARDEFQTK